MFDSQRVLGVAETLISDGRILEAIGVLTAANRVRNSFVLEQRLVELRHEAWGRLPNTQPVGDWPRPQTDLFPGSGNPPECTRDELTADLLGSALQHRGSLIVRGLLSPEWCALLRRDIDLGMDAARQWVNTPESSRRSEWFSPFGPAAHELTPTDRKWLSDVGTAYTAESPRTLFHLLEALDEARVDRLLTEYFGERPAFSLIKCAFRRTSPDAGGGWHQDGYVAGSTTRAVNIWVVVSPCGSKAPGLDLLPRRMHSLLPTAKGLPFDFVIPPEAVEDLAKETPICRPDFEAGDALLFDQWLVHQTGSGDNLTETRYGFECWFFAPSTFPVKWHPFIY